MTLGKFITLEGIDGAGKTTHLEFIADYLRSRGKSVVVTREPGGTPIGEALRELVLAKTMHIETETLLMFAARREHIQQVIAPALQKGQWVLSDRFTDATYAYQGGGRGVAYARLAILETWVQAGLQPDLTLLFDVPLAVSRERLARNSHLDRFEQEQQTFFSKVQSAYRERAQAFPQRIHTLDGTQAIPEIQEQIKRLLAGL